MDVRRWLQSHRPWARPAGRFFLIALPVLLTVFIVGRLLDLTGPRSSDAASGTVPETSTRTRHADRATGQHARRPLMTDGELERRAEVISHAAQYLVRACDEDGRFTYKINLDPSIVHSPRYNLLRHCGTIYALGMHYQWQASDEVLDAMRRATEYLRAHAIGTVPGEDSSMRCVWSRPELTFSGSVLQAKLGGSGLGLVALSAMHREDPAAVPLEEMRGLGRFILFMQKPDGSFHSKYIPSEGGRRDDWTSLYYPGEAALGLLMLYRIDPDPEWASGAIDALEYLARTRRDETDVPADHWALLATATLLELTAHDAALEFDRDLLVGHAVQLCEDMLDEQVIATDRPLLLGGFAPDGRTTPTATRLEGLLAALRFLDDREHRILRRHIVHSIEQGMLFLANAQVHRGTHVGAMPRAMMPLPDDGSSDVRDFNRRATEVRIDYVQHALSAMLQYVHLFGPESARPTGEREEKGDGRPAE